MQIVSQVMTRNVQVVAPQESLQRAAQMMDELNVGALPVCDGDRLVGMVTDRDITVRGTAAGRAPADAHVEEVMSTDVRWCFEDEPIDEVMQQMADTQIRRVPVISHDDDHRLIGIVAIGDLATKTSGSAQKREVELVVEKISSPSEPDRPQQQAQTRRGTDAGRLGSDTGTASGFAGSDTTDIAGSNDFGAESGTTTTGDAGTYGAAGIGITDEQAAARTSRTAGSGRAIEDTAGTTENTGETGAPGGTDAAGVTGASGGTAGTAGSGGTGVGARP